MTCPPAPIDRRAVLAGLAAATVAWPTLAQKPPVLTRLAAGLDRLVAADAAIGVVATDIRWAEGPAWDRAGGALFFSDPPANILRRWTRATGARPFLQPSGAGNVDPALVREPGSNGLIVARDGALRLANSGGRSIDRVDLATRARRVLVDRYRGKRFNSPNDLVEARDGSLFFTDPPYGLADPDHSPLRELPHNGVYRWRAGGEAELVDGELTRPNGIGLSPDGRRLYVSVSDEAAPRILVYDLDARGHATNRRLLLDAKGMTGPGLPDGMKVAANGTLLCSAPGGMYFLSPEGEPLGLVADGGPIANCCFGEAGDTLFLTANHRVLRMPLRFNGWRA
jgi:gluconolactonase